MSPFAPALASLLVLAAPADAAPRASVRLERCAIGDAPEARSATFVARMRNLPGAERLQVRFGLQARAGEDGMWQPVVGDGLGTWNVSEPGVRGYVFAKRIEHVPA